MIRRHTARLSAGLSSSQCCTSAKLRPQPCSNHRPGWWSRSRCRGVGLGFVPGQPRGHGGCGQLPGAISSAREHHLPVDLGQGRELRRQRHAIGAQAHARQWLMAASISVMWMVVMRGERATMRSRKAAMIVPRPWCDMPPGPNVLAHKSPNCGQMAPLKGSSSRFAQGLRQGRLQTDVRSSIRSHVPARQARPAPSPSKTFEPQAPMVGSKRIRFPASRQGLHAGDCPTLSMLPGI